MRIHKEGHTIIIINFLIWAAITGFCFVFCKNAVVNWIVAGVALVMSLFMIWFFRVPVRDAVVDDSLVISPGDGKVVNVKEVEENEYFGEMPLSQFSLPFSMFMLPGSRRGVVKYYKYHPANIFASIPNLRRMNAPLLPCVPIR